MESFSIKGIHFIILIIVFTVILYIVGNIHLVVSTSPITKDVMIELNETNFSDSIDQDSLCLVLFYTAESKSCNRMLNTLSKFAAEQVNKINIYKVDANKYPQVSYKHNISGSPSILIFKNGKEANRIIGVVSLSNLKMIYKRHLE